MNGSNEELHSAESNQLGGPSKVILIDGSYFCFHRFHALKKWWELAEKEPCEDPFECSEFVEKFRSTFIKKLSIIAKKLKIQGADIYVAQDCAKKSIWRNSYIDMYKENRVANSSVNKFFGLAYNELFKHASIKEILKLNKLEADDCIALATKRLLERGNCEIYIIANDMDYLQLACDRVKIYNMSFVNIASSKKATGDAKLDLFCKIVCGDKSDNIPGVFKSCGMKTAIRLYNNPGEFETKLKKEDAIERLNKNRMMVDFDFIPQDLCEEFNQKYLKILQQY